MADWGVVVEAAFISVFAGGGGLLDFLAGDWDVVGLGCCCRERGGGGGPGPLSRGPDSPSLDNGIEKLYFICTHLFMGS